MFRAGAAAIGLLAGLVPAMAMAQTNIDQGKSPAEIFANDCATCHKSPRGLAAGRGSLGLASFLAEHYTASRDQAAALAAYVMGAGGGEAAPARGPKPTADRNKPAEAPAAQPGQPSQPGRTAAKPEQDVKRPPGAVPGIVAEPPAGRPGATASRNRRNEPVAAPPPAPEPATAGVEATPSAPAAKEASPAEVPGPSAAAPTNPDSGESAPVPRDNIPD
jgi:mono/diheme cytochrome c family protein